MPFTRFPSSSWPSFLLFPGGLYQGLYRPFRNLPLARLTRALWAQASTGLNLLYFRGLGEWPAGSSVFLLLSQASTFARFFHDQDRRGHWSRKEGALHCRTKLGVAGSRSPPMAHRCHRWESFGYFAKAIGLPMAF